ncbi:GIP [Symbiodinium natans]|uniref:GIP protein n=1 Tax=Symbiodinium natans TaxID=878477 RepID=A0A812QNS3_9DINO|nr:GIP [Symbiodinium natans]
MASNPSASHNHRSPTGQVMSPMMPQAEGEQGTQGPGRSAGTMGTASGLANYGTLNPGRADQQQMVPMMNGVQPSGVGVSGRMDEQPTLTGPGATTTGLDASTHDPTRAQQQVTHVSAPSDRPTQATEQHQLPVAPQLRLVDNSQEVEDDSRSLAMIPHGAQHHPGTLQAMAQLDEQRSALVSAVQLRARRMVQMAGYDPEGGERLPEEVSEEHMVWHERLRGLFRRRAVEPMRETAQIVRTRTTPMSSPASWYSQQTPHAEPSGPTGSLLDPMTRQAMSEWTQRTSLIQPGPTGAPSQSSGDSVSPEAVQEEVRKQVQLALQGRDQRVQQLQEENDGLRQVLQELLQATPQLRGDGVGRATELRGDRFGLGANETPTTQRMSGDVRQLRQGVPEPEVVVSSAATASSAPPGLEAYRREGDGQERRVSFELPSGELGGGATQTSTGKPTNPLAHHPPGEQVLQMAENESVKGNIRPEGDGVRDDGRSDAASGGKKESDPLQLLAHGIQQLQLLQMKKEGQDPELLKGTIELPKMPEAYVDTSAVAFLEWMYETGQLIGPLTDKAGSWWEAVTNLAIQAYQAYQTETPLQRLKIRANDNEFVDDVKWLRLEKRVMGLLLQAMPPQIKAEIMMLRIDKAKDCVFKLHTIYAPGGTSERASLIRQLEFIPTSDSPLELISALRKWKKLVTRAGEMGVSLPDGSVLLMAIDGAAKKIVEANKDMAFKLNMAKQELQLPYRPFLTSVLTYSDHLLAELQQAIPLTRGEQPKLKGITTESSPTSPTGSPSKGQKAPCKFWNGTEGCRRGTTCKFSHAFTSKASKEDKRSRCWSCGSKNHRQSECPVRQSGEKPTSPPPMAAMTTSSQQPPLPLQEQPELGANQPQSVPASAGTTATTSSGSSSAASTVLFQDPPPPQTAEIRDLAEQFLAKIRRLAPLQVQTDESIASVNLFLKSQGLDKEGVALLDSGATHAFRAAKSEDEIQRSTRVSVQLADGRVVRLRQTVSGTLLPETMEGETGTIVPLGNLVQSLGCSLQWNRKRGLQVFHPEYGLLPTKLVGNCPVLRETEALDLIGELEEAELKRLQRQTLEGTVAVLQPNPEGVTWEEHLDEFIQTGSRQSLRRAMLDPDFPLGPCTETEILKMVGSNDYDFSDREGAKMMRGLPMNRANRRAMMNSRWMVHLFSGMDNGREVESDALFSLKIDIVKSKGFNLMNNPAVMKTLLRAAARGQLEGLYGGPPRQGDNSELLMKMFWLVWIVGQRGSKFHGVRPTFVAMEQPGTGSFWKDMAWTKIRETFGLMAIEMNPDEGQLPYILATNLDVEGQVINPERWEEEQNAIGRPPSNWSTALKEEIYKGMKLWRTNGGRGISWRQLARMMKPQEMTEKEIKHCGRTMSERGTFPTIAGPFRVKGETADAQHYRYLLVGAYCHPRLESSTEGKRANTEVEEPKDDDPLEDLGLGVDDDDPMEEIPTQLPKDEPMDEHQRELNERFRMIYQHIGDDIEYQTLDFVKPMKTQDGLPLTRVHSDRGRELQGHPLRAWLSERDVLVTTAESQQPRQNGRAEALVKRLKTRCRTLLRSSGLPRTCWPLAACFAAKQQRDLALGRREDKDLTFGTTTFVKGKTFGTGGSYDLDERWVEGKFVGYSSDVHQGRVVRLDNGKYITSVHFRPYLVDSDKIHQPPPLEAHWPEPERRVKGKTTLASIQQPCDPVEQLAKEYLEGEKFELKAISVYTGHNNFTSLIVADDAGMGMHRDSHNEPHRENVLVPLDFCEGGGVWVESMPQEFTLDDEWRKVPSGEWRRGRVRELQPGEPICFGPRRYHQTEPWKGRRLVVTLYTPRTSNLGLDSREALNDLGFNVPDTWAQPREAMSTSLQPMLAMIGMVPQDKNVDAVTFRMGVDKEEVPSEIQLALEEIDNLQEEVIERLQQRSAWLEDFLAEEEILREELAIVSQEAMEEAKQLRQTLRDMLEDSNSRINVARDNVQKVFLKVANLTAENKVADVEEHLNNLKEDLKVTLDVPLEQVKQNLEKWMEAIGKELQNLEKNTGALERISMDEARRLEGEGRLRLVPGKMVFTIKPVNEPRPTSSSPMAPRWKRKARMVICGNRIDLEHDHVKDLLYASGATAESLRVALCIATLAGWRAGSTDITGAFLLAIWPSDKPSYGVLAPKILQQGGFITSEEIFLVKRPLYGLRESPALWASYRTDVLRTLRIQHHKGQLRLKQLRSDSEMWLIILEEESGDTLYGIIVTYVDDLLYLGKAETVDLVHGWISKQWPCAQLEYANQPGGIRYLGMELRQYEDGTFSLGQAGYVENLVRSYGLCEDAVAGLPCPKEWICDTDITKDEENFSEEELRRSQKMTGECLWLSCRTRPDILYVTNFMSSMVSKQPCLVYRTGLKVLAYLNATAGLKLRVDGRSPKSKQILGDHQSPKSEQIRGDHQSPKSVQIRGDHQIFGCVLCSIWRKKLWCKYNCHWKIPCRSRQPMVSMSVCEAELMESATCALLLESVGAILEEICSAPVPRELRIDNSAAGSILNGAPGSWRTRHLRIRHAYVIDRVASHDLTVKHIPGDLQLADLPTKLHPKARLMELLRLWAMFGIPELDRMHAAEDLRLCDLVLAMTAIKSIGVEARQTGTSSYEKEPLATTGTMELILLLSMSCVVAVACWELAKWSGTWCWNKFFGTKRDRKIKRLRQLAQLAAEAEVEKVFERTNDDADKAVQDLVSGAMSVAMSSTTSTTRTTRRSVAIQTLPWEPEERIVHVPQVRERIVHVPEVRERTVRVEVPVADDRYERSEQIYMTENLQTLHVSLHGVQVYNDGSTKGRRVVTLFSGDS